MTINDRDIELINMVQKDKKLKKEDVLLISKDEMINLTILLGELIGYDSNKDDIDTLGEEADRLISKLLKILELRGEM